MALAALSARCEARSTVSRSASASSVLIVATSEAGSTRPDTCTTSGSSKQRTTCAIASNLADVREELVAEALALRSAGDEARDVHELDRGRHDFFRLRDGGKRARRGSGTGTMPTFGSIVQKDSSRRRCRRASAR
jgi:hypothetical protein